MYDSEKTEQHLSSDELAERQLLARHVQGDSDAFGKFMQLYQRRIYAFLWRLGLNSETLEDTFQNAMLQLHVKAALYSPERALAPWVFTLVLNLVRDQQRKRSQALSALTQVVANRTASSNPSPLEQSEARETSEFLRAELAKLPEEQREVFSLAACQGLELQSIAEVTALPLNTVKSHLHRTRLSLAQALRRRSSCAARELAS
jgi:RNA polymerase sigma-70 factor (ECF subfamily)